MKIKGIILFACLALLLHDASCARLPCCGDRSNDDEILPAAKLVAEPVAKTIVGNYELGENIGNGAFSEVSLSIDKITGKKVAIKIMVIDDLSEIEEEDIRNEIAIQKSLDHANIVKLHEFIETETHFYLVMEYADGGDLFYRLRDHGRMDENEAREKFWQIVSAVEYLHLQNIGHRDLKTPNIVIFNNHTVKITDFGAVVKFKLGDTFDKIVTTSQYMAPEGFKREKYNAVSIDIWSLGIILYELTMGKLLFNGENDEDISKKVINDKFSIPAGMSPECGDLISKILVHDPKDRYTLEQIKKHEWMHMGNGQPKLPTQPVTASESSGQKDINSGIGDPKIASEATETLQQLGRRYLQSQNL